MSTGTVGVVGLGLIGGSLVKAYKAAGWTVYGYDLSDSVTRFAELDGMLDGELTPETTPLCDIIHLAVPPEAACAWMRDHAAQIDTHTLLMDDCGTKRVVCACGFALARDHGYCYVGGHPMAGTHLSGYKNARADLFQGAPMVIVPPRFDDPDLYGKIKLLLAPMGLGQLVFATAEEHDRMIAFTSQLAHVVSNAYVKSPRAVQHRGFSAGSFRDMTRVAWLNERMWTELFLENGDFLSEEIDTIVANLQEYAAAIRARDAGTLERILREGRIAKEKSEKA